jgi:hypothetical protein
LGAALINDRQLLEESGKKLLFHRFLEAKGIPRSTGYELIKDCERALGAPEILKIAAERGVDLTARKPTFTRALAELKMRQLLQVKGSTLHIRNKAARKTPLQSPKS